MDLNDLTIGFIGAGQMAQALARAWVAQGLLRPQQVLAADVSPGPLQQFAAAIPGASTVHDNRSVLERATLILLAVKPQHMDQVLLGLQEVPKDGKLFLSIAAGIPISHLSRGLKCDRVVRVMPNTPCLIGQGASAFSTGSGVLAADVPLVDRLLGAVGLSLRLDESLLDAVTGLSGSGPAYVYQVIEALSDGGVRVGLPRDVALRLAAQTVRGAAEMVLTTQEHPAVLKDRVTSPGGTTIAGLKALESGGLRAALMSAVEAATERSRQLRPQS